MNKQKINILDKGFIRVVDTMGDDSEIVESARVSYGGATKSKEEDDKLINYLMKHNHTSPFEMSVLKIHAKVPVCIAQQWLRHRTASVNQISARYTKVKEEWYTPKEWRGQSKTNKQCSKGVVEELKCKFEYNVDVKEGNIDVIHEEDYNSNITSNCLWYQKNIENGMSKEMARMILPQSMYTEFYWKIDLHNLMHFIKLRDHDNAQYEIREYAKVLKDIVKEWCPVTYEAFMEHQVNAVKLSASQVEHLKQVLNKSDELKCLSRREEEELKTIFGI